MGDNGYQAGSFISDVARLGGGSARYDQNGPGIAYPAWANPHQGSEHLGMSTDTQILIMNLNADKIRLQARIQELKQILIADCVAYGTERDKLDAEIAELKRENARLKDRAPW